VNKNTTVEVCADCRGYAEAPFTPRVDTAGQPTEWVLCLDCHEALLNRLSEQLHRHELGDKHN
jgi:hypothetical protein